LLALALCAPKGVSDAPPRPLIWRCNPRIVMRVYRG
jgi:hypothetical protein